MVSDLYEGSYEYLGDSLNAGEKAFFESIRLNAAPVEHWRNSLKRLSYFLARKSERRVMVFIDEYEAPNNRAYELGFFAKVRPSYLSRLRSRLRIVIQANKFFGRGVLPALLKVTMIQFSGFYGGTSNVLIQSNPSIEYAILVDVTPVRYSGLNNLEVCRFTLAKRSTT
jgi:hypothetical protein